MAAPGQYVTLSSSAPPDQLKTRSKRYRDNWCVHSTLCMSLAAASVKGYNNIYP